MTLVTSGCLREELEIFVSLVTTGCLRGGTCWAGNSRTDSPLLSDPIHITESAGKGGKHPLIFIQQMFIKHLLCARLWPGPSGFVQDLEDQAWFSLSWSLESRVLQPHNPRHKWKRTVVAGRAAKGRQRGLGGTVSGPDWTRV